MSYKQIKIQLAKQKIQNDELRMRVWFGNSRRTKTIQSSATNFQHLEPSTSQFTAGEDRKCEWHWRWCKALNYTKRVELMLHTATNCSITGSKWSSSTMKRWMVTSAYPSEVSVHCSRSEAVWVVLAVHARETRWENQNLAFDLFETLKTQYFRRLKLNFRF